MVLPRRANESHKTVMARLQLRRPSSLPTFPLSHQSSLFISVSRTSCEKCRVGIRRRSCMAGALRANILMGIMMLSRLVWIEIQISEKSAHQDCAGVRITGEEFLFYLIFSFFSRILLDCWLESFGTSGDFITSLRASEEKFHCLYGSWNAT